MLFDLFALVDFSMEIKDAVDPFARQEVYKKLTYHKRLSEHPHASIVSLYKREPDALSFFEDERVEVYIFGYCFPRMDSHLFKEQKRLTASQLAFAYREQHQHMLKQLKGSFSVLILDKEKRQLQLFTDPLNVRPAYYYQKGSRLAVSTSQSAIVQYMQSMGEEPEIDEVSVMEYYLFEYGLGHQTYIRSVSCMPPGGWLSFTKEEGRKERQYWNAFEDLKNFKIEYKEEEGLDKLEEVLKHNIDLYLSGGRPTAVALTGGFDSRTNLALLGDRAKDFLFYSYGIADTYDMTIPQEIAQKTGLRYKPIYLHRKYQEQYSRNARQAIGMGDGIAEANRANYLYAFRELGKEYDSILTGLFGSELIKHPTSVGNFINQRSKRLLNSQQPAEEWKKIIEEAKSDGFIQPEMLKKHGAELEERVLNNPYLMNDHPMQVKYFYFLLMVGVRKYFMKEIKVERPYVENLHPFLDIEFVEMLLKTPFPWVYHWTGKKDLVKSLQTHRLYVSLIHRNRPELTNILSTHGYKPRYLLHNATLPLMSLQYWYYKDRIKAKSSFKSLEPVWKYFREQPVNGKYQRLIDNHQLRALRDQDTKNNIKLSSLQHWFAANEITL